MNKSGKQNWTLVLLIVSVAVSMATPALWAQESADGEWHSWGGDSAFTRYSSLDQISRDNVTNLRVAWRWSSVDLSRIHI